MNIAIIPARGGSKRIPRKNIKSFLGKPIISYSIEAAIESGCFDEVMVSTDDLEIARVSKGCGAMVPFLRSLKNSTDFATTTDVLVEVIDYYKNVREIEIVNVCCIYPIAPLIKTEHLLEGLNLLNNHRVDSVFPVVPFSYPVWRGLNCEGHFMKMEWPEYYNARSQDLRTLYHDAGQWYWLNAASLLNQKKLFMDRSYGFIMKESEVQDVDTIEDWHIMEMKFQNKIKNIHGV